ncbi:hypothetical protein [Methanoregula sp. UBA64]|uniref:hypothetical protein n=1 Tax=Methanoregula sp. UBA64 TaxID=1915554 RepID=UPI0025EAD605|nr:hypothetical protein [Methanoregula sp. UBA64]
MITTMEGAARVFAGELMESTLSVPDGNGSPARVVTPGGAWCRLVYLCGALTEVTESADVLYCRLGDPTGAFTLVSGGRTAALAEQIRALPVPSFIAVTGTAMLVKKNGGCEVVIRPEHIAATDRAGRDRWIVTTADMTTSRLGLLLDAIGKQTPDEQAGTVIRHYCLTRERLREMARSVEGALDGVRAAPPAQEAPADISGLIMAIVKEKSGPRGVSVDEVVAEAGAQGCTKEAVIAAIRTLVENDDCYQPQKGYVKPL